MGKIIVRGTVLYPHVFQPYSFEENTPGKYEISVMIAKSDAEFMKQYNAAIESVKQDKWDGKVPANLRLPQLTDGDQKVDKNGNKIKTYRCYRP